MILIRLVNICHHTYRFYFLVMRTFMIFSLSNFYIRIGLGCLSRAVCWGPGLQPSQVPWLGIELVILWFTGQHSVHWATPARTSLKAFWIIRVVSVEECSSLIQNLMQIRCCPHLVILNATATQYTRSLNGICRPHWLVQWSCHCSHVHTAVCSPWLSGYHSRYINNGWTSSTVRVQSVSWLKMKRNTVVIEKSPDNGRREEERARVGVNIECDQTNECYCCPAGHGNSSQNY